MPRQQSPPGRRLPPRGPASLRWPAYCRPTWPRNPRASRRTHGRASSSRPRWASPSRDARQCDARQRDAQHHPARCQRWSRRAASRPHASSGASWLPPGCSGRAAPRARASGCGGGVTSDGRRGRGVVPHKYDTRALVGWHRVLPRRFVGSSLMCRAVSREVASTRSEEPIDPGRAWRRAASPRAPTLGYERSTARTGTPSHWLYGP